MLLGSLFDRSLLGLGDLGGSGLGGFGGLSGLGSGRGFFSIRELFGNRELFGLGGVGCLLLLDLLATGA